MLASVGCWLLVVVWCCLLFAVCLFVVRWSLLAVGYVLCGDCCSLFGVCCLLIVLAWWLFVRCSLFVVRRAFVGSFACLCV